MAKFRPIPRSALVHVAKLIPQSGNGWDEFEGAPVELNRVLVQGGSNLKFSINGEENICNKTLFFDTTNSLPKGVEFHEDDKIEWNDNDYIIRKIELCYTLEGEPVHHYELGLV